MSNMTAFISWALGAVADFLASEPIIYLFGVVLLCFVCKALRTLITAN